MPEPRRRRAVITGLGPITPIGTGTAAFWDGLRAQRSAIARLGTFDTTEAGLNAHHAGEVRDWDPRAYFPPHWLKRLDRYAQFAVASARLALEEGLEARLVSDVPGGVDDDDSPLSGSDWVVLYADKAWLGTSKDATDIAARAAALEAAKPGPAWTDDFNNILAAVRLGGTND